MERSWTMAALVALAALASVAVAAISGVTGGPLVALAALPFVAGAVAFAAGRAPRGEVAREVIAQIERRLEEAALEREEMRLRAATAGRFREEFVAAVRHELKTPLNAILGFTQVLLDDLDGPLTPQQREDVVAIRQAGLYLSELVDAVLAEWVPDRSTPMPLASVDLATLVREVAGLLEGQAKKDVRVVVEVAADLPRPLGDARRLRQVLINLGTNALRATVRGSVTLSAAPDPEGVRVTVRDTGIGI